MRGQWIKVAKQKPRKNASTLKPTRGLTRKAMTVQLCRIQVMIRPGSASQLVSYPLHNTPISNYFLSLGNEPLTTSFARDPKRHLNAARVDYVETLFRRLVIEVTDTSSMAVACSSSTQVEKGARAPKPLVLHPRDQGRSKQVYDVCCDTITHKPMLTCCLLLVPC